MSWRAHVVLIDNRLDEELRKTFHDAAMQCIERTGNVDPGLSMGWLHNEACRDIFIEVAERSGYGFGTAWMPPGMSRQDVKVRADHIRWSAYEPYFEPWAFWSVKLFIDTAAALNLRIKFETDDLI